MKLATLLVGPLLGALIGYCTNYIAVKMLFRPLRPIYLFGHQLPFTPGIIPKEQGRMAHAIGSVVGSTLVTEADVKQTLLSDQMKDQLQRSIEEWLTGSASVTLKEACLALSDETGYDAGRQVMQEKLTDVLASRVQEMHLGDAVAAQVLAAVKKKVSGSLAALVVNDDMLAGFASPIRDGVDSYLEGNAYALLRPQVERGWDELECKPVQDAANVLAEAGLPLTDIIMTVYEKLINDKVGGMLRALNLGGIAEEKISAMKPEELEQLVLSVMKKELRAVVNLGALVGFLLGLLNLIF